MRMTNIKGLPAHNSVLHALFQKSEHGNTVRGPNVDFAISNGRSDELVSRAEFVSRIWSLAAVVELGSQIGRVISMENGGTDVLHRPQNRVFTSFGREWKGLRRDNGKLGWSVGYRAEAIWFASTPDFSERVTILCHETTNAPGNSDCAGLMPFELRKNIETRPRDFH